MHVIFKSKAYADIKQIYRYRYRDLKDRGKIFIFNLITYIYHLSVFPELGKLIVEQYQVRKLIYHKYIILYQIDYSHNLIRILKIVQPKQNIDLILKNIQKYL